MIDTIENGMNLAVVRRILNQAITRLNELEKLSGSYNDLLNRPAIDGKTLNEDSSMSDFRIPLKSIESYEKLEASVKEQATEAGTKAAEKSLSGKLTNNFSTLEKKEYELEAPMIVAVDNGNGKVFQCTLGDLMLYLKYEVLKSLNK